MALEIKINNQDDISTVTLVGQINEDALFDEVLNIGSGKIVFDFNEVDSINSCGIRDWIKMLKELNSESITYKNCRQIIIEQMNMVHGFITEGVTVETFFAPYFCEECEHEMQKQLKTTDVGSGEAPQVECPECGHKYMDFDAIADQYFLFLKQIKG